MIGHKFEPESYAIAAYFKNMGKQAMIRNYELTTNETFKFTQGGKEFEGRKLKGKADVTYVNNMMEDNNVSFDFAYIILNNDIKILKKKDN